MHRFVLLLFILGLGQSIYAASFFQFPDLTRRLPERPTSPGCAYKAERYVHGDRVPTAEPCLNCTCIRAVLVCYLRVCPTASAPPPGCFAAREVGECCPTLVCGGADLSPKPNNDSDSSIDLRPTFQPAHEETTVSDSLSTDYSEQEQTTLGIVTTDTSQPAYDSQTEATHSTHGDEHSSPSEVDGLSKTTETVGSSPPSVSPTVRDATFHTTLSKDDSLVYITSTQEPTNDYDLNFFNDIPGGCMVNGTLYGDGSAMLSSTFCEYCFCIRGKSTCLKPKCHLTIDGCVPHYDSHYSCCPSRYDCSQKSSAAEVTKTAEKTTVPTTTQTATTVYTGDCVIDGTVYHQGEVVPDRKPCHNCYCSDSSVVCEKIKCSPPIEGCHPIVPEGQCCPISYRCDYQSGHSASNSIKGSNLNESIPSVDSKGTDIKSVKSYYISNTEDVRVKATNNRESMALLHNVIPVHRRLDEIPHYDLNSTEKSVNEEIPVYIGQRASTNSNDNSNDQDHIRENDKTLDLELHDAAVTTDYAAEERTFNRIGEKSDHLIIPHYASSTVETVSLGSPEIHTLSIQQLFDQFFRRNISASKVPGEIHFEPKRNNSKQPSSIVEIYDSEKGESEFPTTETSNANLQTTVKVKDVSNDDTTINTEIKDLKSDLFTSSYETSKLTDLVSDNVRDRATAITNTDIFSEATSAANEESTENKLLSTLFSTLESKDEDFQSRTDTESTYPLFITTKKDSEEIQDDINPHSVLAAFTSSEDLGTQDDLETSFSSQIFTTLENLFNLKFNSAPPTQPSSKFPFTRDIYNEDQKQTSNTPPVYPTTKAALIDELKLQTQTRPVVLIYDTTPKMHSVSPRTSLYFDGTQHSFTDEPKKFSESNPTPLIYDTTKTISDDNSNIQTEAKFSLPSYTTSKHSYNNLKDDEHLYLSSPVYTSTKNDDNNEKTETAQFTTNFASTVKNIRNESPETDTYPTSFTETTKNINNEGQAKTFSPSLFFMTTKHEGIDDHTGIISTLFHSSATKTETQSSPLPTRTVNEHHAEPETQTSIPFVPSTDTDSKSTANKYETQVDFQNTERPDTESFTSGIEIQTHPPTVTSTKYQNKVDFQKQNISTTISEDKRYDNLESQPSMETTAPIKKVQDKDSSVTTVTPKISSQKHQTTTESTQVSTRINSKLPSFNYIKNVDEKSNTSFYPRYPVLADSVVKAYLPAEGRDDEPKKKEDFANVGSIYLGAPLAVRGTDSRKDYDYGKPKITRSGGVIFLDPKYTDIDATDNTENTETIHKNQTVANAQEPTSTKADKVFSNSERKKEPRNQDALTAAQGHKIIPFVAEDAIRGQLAKYNDTLALQPDGTEEIHPDMVTDFCFVKGRIFMNGEMIGKPDPCEICRCFYGRELCQIQRCPTPPSICTAEIVPGYCCPRFICANNTAPEKKEINEEKSMSHSRRPETISVTTRRPSDMGPSPPTNDRQDLKFGVRVKHVRPTTSASVKIAEHTTQSKPIFERTTTVKPEIRPATNKIPVAPTTTTSRKPTVVNLTINKTRERGTTTTTTTPNPVFTDPWGLLKVSGCNIYGKFFKINDHVELLSGHCSHCLCTINGVECNDLCKLGEN